MSSDMKTWVIDALTDFSGKAKIVDIAEHIWDNHETELRLSRTLFFTWQYQMRWAATQLRKDKRIKSADDSPKGIWELR